jgi:hypothetical protein
MTGILADANFEGQWRRLMFVLQSSDWKPFWDDLNLTIATFATLYLAHDTPDSLVWARCQTEGLVLITGNRNRDGEDSLEEAIRSGNESALPVFTVSNPQRVLEDATYASAVAVDCLDYLIDLRYHPERIRGAGRLFLPKNSAP